MPTRLGQRINLIRGGAELSMEAFGRRVGVTRGAVSQWESGKTEPSANRLRRIATEFNTQYEWLATGRIVDQPLLGMVDDTPRIQVIGEVAAGKWMDSSHADFHKTDSELPPDGRFPAEAQFDLRVSGTSLNNFARDGQFLRCVHFAKAEQFLRDNSIVIFERLRDSGQLREVTAKRVRIRAKVLELWPDSDDPQWKEPHHRVPLGDHEGEQGRIIGLVLYVYAPA